MHYSLSLSNRTRTWRYLPSSSWFIRATIDSIRRFRHQWWSQSVLPENVFSIFIQTQNCLFCLTYLNISGACAYVVVVCVCRTADYYRYMAEFRPRGKNVPVSPESNEGKVTSFISQWHLFCHSNHELYSTIDVEARLITFTVKPKQLLRSVSLRLTPSAWVSPLTTR